MAEREGALKFVDDHFQQCITRLSELAKIKSISDIPEHKPDVLKCAHAAKELVVQSGLQNAQLLTLKNKPDVSPCVYGEWLNAPGQPTVLLYAHYDVQPPGNDAVWRTPAWTPTVVNVPELGGDRLYGRGTADDKAGVVAHLSAVEALLKTTKSLPINVKVLFEGEEEIGSTHLEDFLAEYLPLLKSDVLILADTGNYDIGVPSITYSLRGVIGMDVELKTVKASVHSGMWGGPILDPVVALCKLIGTLHDDKGEIAVEGMMEGVRQISEKEKQNLVKLSYTEEKLRKESGLLDGVKIMGNPSASILEKLWLRPTIGVIAIEACPLETAANKILDHAIARISVRIVPNMQAEHVFKVLKAHLTKHTPYGAHITFSKEDVLNPWVCVPEGEAFNAAERALKLGYGRDSVLVGCGGSIGFVGPFATAFGGAPAILVGVEDPYTSAHGENESLLLDDWKKAIKSIIHLLFELKK